MLIDLLFMKDILSFNKSIQLPHEGYSPFIEFLKAYAIICVVLAHAIPDKYFGIIQFELWGDMQVPLFILIQTFHAYKKGLKPQLKFKKLFDRIMLPFLVTQFVIIAVWLLVSCVTPTLSVSNELLGIAIGGGKVRGPIILGCIYR